MSVYSVLADIVVFTHFLIVLYAVIGEILIIIGGFLKWPWIRGLLFRITHLGVVITVALQAVLGAMCPLTILENRFRETAGQTAEWDISFVGRIFRALVFYQFPPAFFTFLYISFGAIVIITVIVVPPAFKHKRGPLNK